MAQVFQWIEVYLTLNNIVYLRDKRGTLYSNPTQHNQFTPQMPPGTAFKSLKSIRQSTVKESMAL